jgi:hypothetical protein
MKVVALESLRAARNVPQFVVHFWDPRAAELYGHAFGLQKLYAWSLAEAREIARKRDGRIEPL